MTDPAPPAPPTIGPESGPMPVLLSTSRGPAQASVTMTDDPPALVLSWLPEWDATLYGIQLSIGPGQWSPLLTCPPMVATAGEPVRGTLPLRALPPNMLPAQAPSAQAPS